MAGKDLVKMGEQFSGLDRDALIGGPLRAVCSAQTMLAASTVKFIQDVGLDETDGKGARKVRTTSFSFTRAKLTETGESYNTNAHKKCKSQKKKSKA